ncbi:MAG TPA: hypothetical protein VME18_14000 [Acidobacteriaceae bacterium]|nr:hypothetical protein [Acidobacteriaceae bacterium]
MRQAHPDMENQSENVPARSAERGAQAELRGSLSNGARKHAVHTHSRQPKRREGKRLEEYQNEALLGFAPGHHAIHRHHAHDGLCPVH